MSKIAREVIDDVLAEWLAGLRKHTRASVVKALLAQLDDDGFVILPKEPSEKMIEAGHLADRAWWNVEDNTSLVPTIYRAMTKAYEVETQ